MNKKTSTTTSLPPLIREYFDAQLLCTPAPKFGDNSEAIWQAYQNIIECLRKKVSKNPRRRARFDKLDTEFLELYGRTAIKEKEREAEKGNASERPFYYITVANKRDNEVFRRLKYRWKPASKKIWGNY